MKPLKPNAWKGKRCFVVGGGPSLMGFDFDVLANEKTIAINRSFEVMPHADCFMSMDYRFYQWLKQGEYGLHSLQKWDQFQGLKYFLNTDPRKFSYPDCIELKFAGFNETKGKEITNGFPESFEKGLYSGSNSGYAGVQLAILLGANPIILLGFDMNKIETVNKHGKVINKCHYHEEYRYTHTQYTYARYIRNFGELAPILKQKGIKVINVNNPTTCGLKCFEFGEIDIIKPNKWKVVSFYTPDYKDVAMKLKRDLDKHKIKYLMTVVPKEDDSRYAWKMTTLFKAEYIYKMLRNNWGYNIVWIDADARVRKYPKLFDTITQDIGVHYRPRSNGTHELLSGTIFFKNTRKVQSVVKKWIDLNGERNEHYKSDQMNLQKVIDESNLKILDLPASYTQIFDSMAGLGKPVIEHFQASRRFKNG